VTAPTVESYLQEILSLAGQITTTNVWSAVKDNGAAVAFAAQDALDLLNPLVPPVLPPVTPGAPVPSQSVPGVTLPTTIQLFDNFVGPLDKTQWSPTWFGNTKPSNNTAMLASNVTTGTDPVSGKAGLLLTLGTDRTGAIVSSNPNDGQHPSGGGFQVAPSPGKPVYVEFKVFLPSNRSGKVANWPALWLDGQVWPEDGELDVEEGLSGYNAWHVHFGTGGGQADGATVNSSPGEHYFGMLWSTTGHTAIYDGVVVGADTVPLSSPEYIIMENSLGAGDLLPATMVVEHVGVWK
jgi:hypothetical protein